MKKERIHQGWYYWKDGQEAEKQGISLPHDAMIFERRVPELENGNASGFFPGGKYVYVKQIFGEEALRDQTVLVEFEGVYMNSTVYLNGEQVGGWVYGYTNFYVDLTGKLRIGQDNELKVIADNSRTPNSRWYSGSGIYRPVNLWTGGRSHILPEGLKVRTLSVNPALLEVSAEVCRGEGMELALQLIHEGKVLKTQTMAVSAGIVKAVFEVPDAKLWSAETPNLYTIQARLLENRKEADSAREDFGIRTLAWDAEKGFQVNGQTVKLKGGCIHHDHGILGACSYDKAEYRRVRKLKELGFNALRYSHNPAGKSFLKACDELGMYVVDETFDQWKLPQSTYDYAMYFDTEWKKDVEALVSKDYNHPCVIMYCIGNEITDTGLPHGAAIAKMISDAFHQLDPTRPTTLANNAMLTTLAALQARKKAEEEAAAENDASPGRTAAPQSKEKTMGSTQVNDIVTLLPKIMASITPESLEALAAGCFDAVDIVGYNYGQNLYEGTHEKQPDRVILSSETFPCRMASNWKMVEEHPYVIGDFLWTAWDYLGEAGVGQPVYGTTQAPFSKDYPCLTAACGSVDLTGEPESQAYYNAVLWGNYRKPYIGVRPVFHSGEEFTLGRWRLTDSINSWTWPGCEGRIAEIEVYSVGKSVELFQDGMSLGKKILEDCRADFTAQYRPGRLEAVSYNEAGEELGRDVLTSAGKEQELRILPEETSLVADGEDLVYVLIHVTDSAGVRNRAAECKITVTVEGPGELLAVGSGRPETEEDFHSGSCTSWNGRILAVVRSKQEAGSITVTAEAEGLKEEKVHIEVRAVERN